MTNPRDLSANEIETLVFKAARGGGLPLGHAEDLAAAVPFLDLDSITACPCADPDPLAICGPIALDFVAAGQGPQQITGDGAVIAAFVALYESRLGRQLDWNMTVDGAVFHRFDKGTPDHQPLGRREVPPVLLDHLQDMAARLLVPDSEGSRTAGAGAGLNDND